MSAENFLTKSPSRIKVLLEAYKDRKAKLDNLKLEDESRLERKITSKTPVRYVDKTKIPKIGDRWWNKEPTIAGETMNSSQARLSQVDHFTVIRKQRFDHTESNITGDFCDDPSKARKLLMNLSYRDLTIPKRSQDFRTGVEWRLTLRPNIG